MKLLVSVVASLLSISAFAGSISIKMPVTQTALIPAPASATDCTGRSFSGPYAVFQDFAVEYSGDGTFQLNLLAMRLASPDLEYATYESVMAGDELNNMIDTTPVGGNHVASNKCALHFGEIDMNTTTSFSIVDGYIKVLGTETDLAGNVKALMAQIPVSLTYEAFRK